MNKKTRVHPSNAVRLTVFAVGFFLSARQGGSFQPATVAEMIPIGFVRQVKPLLPTVLLHWHLHSIRHALPSSGRTVKVRLFEDQHVRELTIACATGLKIGRHTYHSSIHIRKESHGIFVLAEGRTVLRKASVEIEGISGSPLILSIKPRNSRRTTGSLHIAALADGLEVVNRLDLEDYVLGTVQPELGSLHMPIEAVKAQIIASRSYVLALHDRHPRKDYDFCDTAHCLMFAGIHTYPPRFVKAAEEVRGVYLSYRGHPAAAFFHHSCGGETAAVEDVWPVPPVAYLKRIVDGTPANCRFAQWTEWSFIMERSSLQKCFVAQGWIPSQEALESLEVIRKDSGERARQIKIQSSQTRWVSANKFRTAINHYYRREVLRSTRFTITRVGNQINFDGRGWGHGVGLCQSGSIQLARMGKTYRDILAHYYPGTTLQTPAGGTKLIRKSDSVRQTYFSTVSDEFN